MTPPLGINYIGKALKRDLHDVKIFDYNVLFKNLYNEGKKPDDPDVWDGSYFHIWHERHLYEKQILPFVSPYLDTLYDKFSIEVKSFEPEVIAFSVFQTNVLVSIDIAKNLKREFPHIRIVFGGPEVEVSELDYLVNEQIVDALIPNEGEGSIRELVKIWEAGVSEVDIPGVKTLSTDKFQFRQQLKLDDLPILDYEDFDLYAYDQISLPFSTSRGCIALCTFCDEPNYWGRFRYRSPELIVDEMEFNLKKYGIDYFVAMDSLINGHIRNLKRMAEIILERGLKLQFAGNVRVSKHMDYDYIKTLKDAGCSFLSFGLESGSQKVLDMMKKNIKLEWAEQNFKACTEVGIEVHLNTLVGFPGENEDDFQMTLDFLKKNKDIIDLVNMGSGMGIHSGIDVQKNPHKYDFRLNEDGTIYREENGQWMSRDGSNNFEVREDRLRRLRELVVKENIRHTPTYDVGFE